MVAERVEKRGMFPIGMLPVPNRAAVKALAAKAPVLIVLVLSACSPAAPGPQPVGGPSQASPQRTMTIAVRGEPPSLAARPLVTFSGALAGGTHPFNATLDYKDDRGTTQPLLGEDLPRLGTETWQVFPDGTMET